VVPAGFVDRILPLSINPAPTQIARVFLGRMELITRATEKAVGTALASSDQATLQKYGRFLEPILHTMMAKESNHSRARKLGEYLSAINSAQIMLRLNQK